MMETEFIDWLKDKETFLIDQVENSRPGFTEYDALILAGVRGALALNKQWLASGGIEYWKGNSPDISDGDPATLNRRKGGLVIRNMGRRARIRRASDLSSSARVTDIH
jgi:hypothetical protein